MAWSLLAIPMLLLPCTCTSFVVPSLTRNDCSSISQHVDKTQESDDKDIYNKDNTLQHPNRREYLVATTAIVTTLLTWEADSELAGAAAAPVTSKDTQSIGSRTIRILRPKPLKLLRNKVDLDFAVLLMRSSYQVTGKNPSH